MHRELISRPAPHFIIFCMLSMLLGCRLPATPLEDFEGNFNWFIHDAANRGQGVVQSAAPQPRGKSAKISWIENHSGNFVEFFDPDRPLLTNIGSDPNGAVSLALFCEKPDTVKAVTLRLLDAQNEVIQWTQEVAPAKSQWQTIAFDIRPGKFLSTYKLNAQAAQNNRIDPPVRFFGVGLRLEGGYPGSVYLDDLETWAAGSTVTALRPLWDFDLYKEQWNLTGSIGRIESSGEDALLTCAPRSQAGSFTLYERYRSINLYDRFSRIALNAELIAGSGIGFHLRLLDANGETLQYKNKPLLPGANHLTWDLSSDFESSWGGTVDRVLDFPVKVSEMIVTRSASNEEARIRLVSGSILTDSPALQAVDVDVRTGSSFPVLKTGEENRLALLVRNRAQAPLAFDLTSQWTDLFGNCRIHQRRFSLPAGGSETWQIPGPEAKGYWRVDNIFADGLGNRWFDFRTVSYMDPAGPTSGTATGFLFGICTHTDRWGSRDQDMEAEALALCGAKVARTTAEWGGIQTSQATWQWSTMDRLVDIYSRQNVEIQFLFAYTPKWAAPPDKQASTDWLDWSRAAPDMNAWQTYVSAVASRYKDKIRHYEIWNEPDTPAFWRATDREYRDRLKTACQSIKAANPGAQVMTGGFASVKQFNYNLVNTVATNDEDFFDILAIHIHGDFTKFREQIDGTPADPRSLMEIHGRMSPRRPLYFNETALSSPYANEFSQAETLIKKLVYAWARGAMAYTWYDLRNDGYSQTEHEFNYGMLRTDFQPKPVYPVFNTLATLLSDKQFLQEYHLGSSQYAFLFGNGNNKVMVAWNESPGAGDQPLRVSTDAAQALVVDMMGNRTPVLDPQRGKAILPLRPRPACLLLEGAKSNPALEWPPNPGNTAVHHPWALER